MKNLGNRGFAMPVAIFALVVILSMVTGMFFTTRQDGRIASATESSRLAFYAAERGMVDVLDDWSTLGLNSLSQWDSETFVDTVPEGIWSVEVYRAGTNLFFLESVGNVNRGGAILSDGERHLGMMVRALTPELEPPAAIVTRGGINMQGKAAIHGEDMDPTEWSGLCTGSFTDKPGLVTDDASQISIGAQSEITGTPQYVEDTSISDSTFSQFGEFSWDELTGMAGKIVSGGTISDVGPSLVGGACNVSDLFNWGDPLNPSNPCGSYAPMIHVQGDLRIQSGGVGQGILLVDGTLDLRGNFTFYGLIIVQGNFETQGSGNRIIGGVLAGNASLQTQSLVGGSVVQTSTCAVRRAIENNPVLNRPRPLAQRSWVDLSLVR